jgi:hypothetical protein
MFRAPTAYPGDLLIRKYVGKFKMFPKNVPTVFFVMSPQFTEPVKFKMCGNNSTEMFHALTILGKFWEYFGKMSGTF